MTEHEVIIYTTPFCVPCEELKNFLKSECITFSMCDLMMDEEAQEKIDNSGIRTTPILELEGKLYYGDALSPSKIRELLEL